LAKIGPNRLLETEWVKDSILKGNCFVLFAGSGVAGDQQWTFHHPIGETPLDDRDWVATPTRDIGYLLQRRESEALSAWKRKMELAIRGQVLRASKGRKYVSSESTEEIWTFENAPAIQPTIRSCMTAAKAAGAQESAWLSYADRAVQSAEAQFKEALRTERIFERWLRVNPRPAHETMGGPLGGTRQKAVPFLNGLSLASAKDKVIRVAIGLDTTEDVESDNESDNDEDEEDDNDHPDVDQESPAKPVAPSPPNSLVAVGEKTSGGSTPTKTSPSSKKA
jgi:hypothetical protein